MYVICKDKRYAKAAEFYAEKLGIPKNVVVRIKLKKRMKVAGYCEEVISEAGDILRGFLICIQTKIEHKDQDDPLEILAHEMVHVKQYALNELKDVGNLNASWHGKVYEGCDVNSDEYFFLPWEVEAFGMQVGLYQLYLRKYG